MALLFSQCVKRVVLYISVHSGQREDSGTLRGKDGSQRACGQ